MENVLDKATGPGAYSAALWFFNVFYMSLKAVLPSSTHQTWPHISGLAGFSWNPRGAGNDTSENPTEAQGK